MAILELKMSRDKIEQHKKKVLGTMERNRYSALFFCIYKKNKVLIYMYIYMLINRYSALFYCVYTLIKKKCIIICIYIYMLCIYMCCIYMLCVCACVECAKRAGERGGARAREDR